MREIEPRESQALDPVLPRLEEDTRRRRRRPLFRHNRIPVRMLVPNFFTLLGLCAGLTAIRMAIEGRYDVALAAIVFAALLDGIDGRLARMLKASSRFGAELDSLADFVNFGVAPAIVIFTWGSEGVRSLAWIVVMVFALASALRLARFNVALDEEKPRWQSNYFTGMPTPAAAIVVLLPVYLEQLGIPGVKSQGALLAALAYTLFIAFMMVSSIPTYSGKLLSERISREMVLPVFMVAVGVVALLVTYPYLTLTAGTILYLLLLPLGVLRYRHHMRAMPAEPEKPASGPHGPADSPPSMRVVEIKSAEPRR